MLHTCVVCGNTCEERDMVRVTQANRASRDNRGTGFICERCASDTAKRNARNKEVRGSKMVVNLDYRITIPCSYSAQARAEFCKSAWLACNGALKSPKYQNLKWQRKLETLDALLASGDVVLTGKVSVSVLHNSDTLESERIEYAGKDEFLGFVRALVDGYKLAVYMVEYGKPFHYGKDYEKFYGEPCDWRVFAKKLGLK